MRRRLMANFFPLLAAAAVPPVSAAHPPADAVVVFNEIHYNPVGSGEEGEFIELVNLLGVDMDVSGWRLGAGVDYTFPIPTRVPGGGAVVVAKTPALLPGSLGPFAGQLANGGETLRLLDNNGRLMDELDYGDKGEWPVAPDGSGATLAKLNPHRRSADARSWAFSPSPGGTPGAPNFPGPSTLAVLSRSDTWRFTPAGPTLPAGWTEPGFDDSSWTFGPGALGFGDPGLFEHQAPVTNGVWTLQPWTGDADSGIAATKTYTHKIGLHRNGPYSAINGVVFDSPGAEVRSGANWSLTGATSSFVNNGNGGGFNNLPAGSGSRQLCEEFFYNSVDGKSSLLLTGLIPGLPYAATFYTVGFGTAGGRRTNLVPSDTGLAQEVDENALGGGAGMRVILHYVAPANGRIAIDFAHLPGATWHHYAFSNEAVPLMPSPVTGVAVSSQSSQLTSGIFTRLAAHAANGAGLAPNGQSHGTTPDGTMWLSNGLFATPNDPLPAEITFDLGAARTLTHLRVWNYNEASLTNRGAKDVTLAISTNPAGPFVTASTNVLRQASGTTAEFGQLIPVSWPAARYVRLTITSNHGDANQFAGLSEVRFHEQAPVSSGAFRPYREPFPGVFATGVSTNGTLLAPGQNDPHYTNVTGGSIPAVTQAGHPAWMAADGVSQWSGPTGNGQDSLPGQSYVWRTTFPLTAAQAAEGSFAIYAAADNRLNTVTVNGNAHTVNAVGFTSLLGPYPLAGFQAGPNTVDFTWANDSAGPGGIRIRWEALAPPTNLARTAFANNPSATLLRKSFTWSGNPASDRSLFLQYAVDDGAVFYLNGVEIHRTNVTGTVTGATLADSEITHPVLGNGVTLPGDALVPGENVLAVSLHQASASDPDALFFATLDIREIPPAPDAVPPARFSELGGLLAGPFFVELANTSAAPVSLAGWSVASGAGAVHTFAPGAEIPAQGRLTLDETTLGFRPADGDQLFLFNAGGAVLDAEVIRNNGLARDGAGAWLRPNAATPGAPNTFTLAHDVVIHEILYHRAPIHLPTGTIDQPEEWIELFNRGAAPVDLTGWRLSGGTSFAFPPGTTLAPGAYLVAASDPAALATAHPHLTVGATALGPLAGSLSNQGDEIRLEDANGNPADTVRYYDDGRWDRRADGGGSSLELKNPFADNSLPESWAASDESARAAWQTFTYSGSAATYPGSSEPNLYNELILGLNSDGECLVDDISVTEAEQGGRECVQNGTFATGTTAWRLLGTHGLHGKTLAVPDPDQPANPVLRLVADGPQGHMQDHLETTLKSGGGYVTITPANTYTISFRARWVSGCPRLHTRLYFNRLARQHLLPMPALAGTPGQPNSRAVANTGPDLDRLAHAPVLPEENEPVTVSVAADDAQGLASVNLKWRLDGEPGFTTAPMTASNGLYRASLPGRPAGGLAQFYVEATDTAGAVSTLPARGPASRALVRWRDLALPYGPNQPVRVLMLTADANVLHAGTNVMSNLHQPCTILDRDTDVFYDAGAHLRSSQRGRLDNNRVGFSLRVDPMTPFRGAHTSVGLDRSGYGRGTTGNGNGVSEIVSWRFMARAGGLPVRYDDMVHVFGPRAANSGSALLLMADFNDAWMDSSYENGAAGGMFKYDYIYYPTTTTGGPEGYKIAVPDQVLDVNFGSINTPDKEGYRWHFLQENAAGDDDYSAIIALNNAFRLSGPAFAAAVTNVVDVDSFLRGYAALTLAGIGDNYNNGARHNIKFYHRSDDRLVMIPWDLDFQSEASNAGLIRNGDITALMGISETWRRRFYFHLRDIIDSAFNPAHMGPWVDHYATFNGAGGSFPSITTYIGERAAFVNAEIAAAVPPAAFAITTNGGNDFPAPGPTATLQGTGGVEIDRLRLQPGGLVLAPVWSVGGVWTITIPIAPGANAVTVEALDGRGGFVGTDTLVITGTGTALPAAAGTLVISELHYHPADPSPVEQGLGFADADDFEYIELLNVCVTCTVSLTGCRFTSGIDHPLPSTLLAPGGRLVVPRRAAAFALRHPGVPVAPEYALPTGNTLSNNGEEIALVDAFGRDITRFTYGQGLPWPSAADGQGPSLVLIAPGAGEPNRGWGWRASTTSDGTPGGTDALAPPPNPQADDDFDGVPNWVEYATGADAPRLEILADPATGRLEFSFERHTRASVRWTLESSPTLSGFAEALPGLTLTARTPLPGERERLTFRQPAPAPGDIRGYYRTRLILAP